MVYKSKLALFAAAAAAGMAAPALAEYIRNYGSLLAIMAQRIYIAHMEKVQMRLAPTRRAGDD